MLPAVPVLSYCAYSFLAGGTLILSASFFFLRNSGGGDPLPTCINDNGVHHVQEGAEAYSRGRAERIKKKARIK
jgi:hypothetical protein